MNWSEIKSKAKSIYHKNMWNIWKPILVVACITFIIELIITIIFKESAIGSSISSLVSIALLPMQIGITRYILDIVREKEANMDYLKEYYDKILVIIVISLLVGIFTALGLILFIVPGIIIALGYSMVNYIFAENKEITASGVLKRSKNMMNGYKMDYFLFCLSFIGWFLLGAITFGILYIWIIPYVMSAQAIYYDELSKKQIEQNQN